MLGLQRGLFGEELLVRDGELGPFVEDLRRLGPGAALHLGFDGPWDRGFVVFLEDGVGAECVPVLC